MIYAKVVNGVLEYAPTELYTEDNLVIELKTHKDYIENGYKTVITKKPFYDDEKYNLLYVGFEETEFLITLQYELKEKVIAVDNTFETLKEIYNEEINK